MSWLLWTVDLRQWVVLVVEPSVACAWFSLLEGCVTDLQSNYWGIQWMGMYHACVQIILRADCPAGMTFLAHS